VNIQPPSIDPTMNSSVEQNPAASFEKYRLYVLFYLILISSALFAAFYDWNFDDAYITFRYASNLANGQGFVYNPGRPVLIYGDRNICHHLGGVSGDRARIRVRHQLRGGGTQRLGCD